MALAFSGILEHSIHHNRPILEVLYYAIKPLTASDFSSSAAYLLYFIAMGIVFWGIAITSGAVIIIALYLIWVVISLVYFGPKELKKRAIKIWKRVNNA